MAHDHKRLFKMRRGQFSLKDFRNQTGLGYDTINKIEIGENVTPRSMSAYCRALGIEPESVLIEEFGAMHTPHIAIEQPDFLGFRPFYRPGHWNDWMDGEIAVYLMPLRMSANANNDSAVAIKDISLQSDDLGTALGESVSWKRWARVENSEAAPVPTELNAYHSAWRCEAVFRGGTQPQNLLLEPAEIVQHELMFVSGPEARWSALIDYVQGEYNFRRSKISVNVRVDYTLEGMDNRNLSAKMWFDLSKVLKKIIEAPKKYGRGAVPLEFQAKSRLD